MEFIVCVWDFACGVGIVAIDLEAFGFGLYVCHRIFELPVSFGTTVRFLFTRNFNNSWF